MFLRTRKYASVLALPLCTSTLLLTLAASPYSRVSAQAASPSPSATTSENGPDARQEYTLGSNAFDAGNYAEALEHFERSHALSGQAVLLYNIGVCHERLRHESEAIETYRQFLAALPNHARAPELRARIELMESERRTRIAENTTEDRPSGGDITGEWWFWALIGVGVAGAAAGITAAVVSSSGGTEGPLVTDTRIGNGGVVSAIRF